MSSQLREVVIKKLASMGKSGPEKLSLSMDARLSATTIRKAKRGEPLPGPTAYALALACGCDKDLAEAIALECEARRAKETA